jgi:hypothetical protein
LRYGAGLIVATEAAKEQVSRAEKSGRMARALMQCSPYLFTMKIRPTRLTIVGLPWGDVQTMSRNLTFFFVSRKKETALSRVES